MVAKFISLGENCIVGAQIERRFGASGGYFNYIITPSDGLLMMLAGDLTPPAKTSLSVGVWDTVDSVIDLSTGIYYHHEFEFPLKKYSDGRRQIPFSYIEEGYESYQQKYNYLAERFLTLMRSEEHKVLVRRAISGEPADLELMKNIDQLLRDLGGRNYDLVCAHDSDLLPLRSTLGDFSYFRVEDEDHAITWRMNDASWDRLFDYYVGPTDSPKDFTRPKRLHQAENDMETPAV